jgi:hypothetical protein
MVTMRRLAAAFALVALLACSSAGTCWAMLATAGSSHDCCESDGGALSAPTRPCASTLATVAQVDLVPPAIVPGVLAPAKVASPRAPVSAFSAAFPVIAPPLVLRI